MTSPVSTLSSPTFLAKFWPACDPVVPKSIPFSTMFMPQIICEKYEELSSHIYDYVKQFYRYWLDCYLSEPSSWAIMQG